jgi:hypothetical protein
LTLGVELLRTFFDDALEMIGHPGFGVAFRDLVVRGTYAQQFVMTFGTFVREFSPF